MLLMTDVSAIQVVFLMFAVSCDGLYSCRWHWLCTYGSRLRQCNCRNVYPSTWCLQRRPLHSAVPLWAGRIRLVIFRQSRRSIVLCHNVLFWHWCWRDSTSCYTSVLHQRSPWCAHRHSKHRSRDNGGAFYSPISRMSHTRRRRCCRWSWWSARWHCCSTRCPWGCWLVFEWHHLGHHLLEGVPDLQWRGLHLEASRRCVCTPAR